MEATLAPRLREAVLRLHGIPIFPLIAEVVTMGDECHSRNHAGVRRLLLKLVRGLLDAGLTSSEFREVYDFVEVRDYFLLNLTMAACKAAWLEAEKVQVPASSPPFRATASSLPRAGRGAGLRRSRRKWMAAAFPASAPTTPTATSATAPLPRPAA